MPHYKNSPQRQERVIAFWLLVCVLILALSTYLGSVA